MSSIAFHLASLVPDWRTAEPLLQWADSYRLQDASTSEHEETTGTAVLDIVVFLELYGIKSKNPGRSQEE